MSKLNRILSPINDPSLLKSPLFANMSELEFFAVTAFLERKHIAKDEAVFNEGDTGKEMFILLSGKLAAFVSQSDGTKRWMFNISPGDFFGEMSVIANEPRSATIVAREESDLMVLQGIDFYRIVFEHPMIGVKLLKAIGAVQNIWLDQTSKHLNDLMRWGETARRRAITDELTGLYNRRFLEESLKDRFDHGSVGLRKMALVMMDLDRVHEINDRYGVQGGDTVIVSVAETIRGLMRPGDIAARLSGDEFAILLPDTDGRDAKSIAEEIRKSVSDRVVPVPRKPGAAEKVGLQVRTSIGIAVAPTHAKNREGLVVVADDALRRAKNLGRDRVELAG
ncbi:GGDEF domain-containing protein [Breznakiella homolactica]|uniref:GGDEF domain-containing protein n=1 Tax=Breznakiella homolactica TaxID=2798577 RepID=UPI001CBA6073|nr:GGDEF domain-containing protein [Breznakiella homolactica]